MTRQIPRSAIVTGGSRRIGAAIVRALAAEGCAVAIHCHRSRVDADALARELRLHARSAVVQTDLAESGCGAVIDQAAAAIGPLDLLVNCASIFEADEARDGDSAAFNRHMAINARAPILLASAFARQAPEGASVVNIVDQRVWRLTPRFFSYTLSKAALWTATQTMAQAFAPRVRVNAVGPGPTLANARQAPEDFARQASAIPLARAVAPAEVADAVLWLARARSVTGQFIAVDGGQHLAWRTPDADGTE